MMDVVIKDFVVCVTCTCIMHVHISIFLLLCILGCVA